MRFFLHSKRFSTASQVTGVFWCLPSSTCREDYLFSQSKRCSIADLCAKFILGIQVDKLRLLLVNMFLHSFSGHGY